MAPSITGAFRSLIGEWGNALIRPKKKIGSKAPRSQ
jgi:hypothetical protein